MLGKDRKDPNKSMAVGAFFIPAGLLAWYLYCVAVDGLAPFWIYGINAYSDHIHVVQSYQTKWLFSNGETVSRNAAIPLHFIVMLPALVVAGVTIRGSMRIVAFIGWLACPPLHRFMRELIDESQRSGRKDRKKGQTPNGMNPE